MKRLAYLATFAVTALLLLVPTASGVQNPEVVKVSIHDFYFEPSELVIEPGTTVRWVNEGDTQHTVFATNPAGTFLSGTLDPGESFTHTFPDRIIATHDATVRPGMYRYYCEFHSDIMKASVALSEPDREGTITQQPPTVPRTGGVNPILLIGLLVMVAVGVLGWAIRRRV
jgi:plastocyanin